MNLLRDDAVSVVAPDAISARFLRAEIASLRIACPNDLCFAPIVRACD